MGNKIAPDYPSTSVSLPKTNKKLFSKLLAEYGNSTLETPMGELTYYQAAVMRIWNIAVKAEDDKNAISAYKAITERIEGKVAVQKAEQKVDMPKLVIAVNEDDLDKIKEQAAKEKAQEAEEEDSDEIGGVDIKFDDGKEMIV